MKASGIHKNSGGDQGTVEIRFRDKHAHISRVLVVLSLLLFLGALALLSFSIRRSLDKQKELTSIVGLAEKQGGSVGVAREIYAVMQELSKTVELPKDELPIFATISDVAKLAGQPIFSTAMNGDQILFYTKAQQIFIYRPSTKMLVVKGPFAIPVVTPSALQPETQQQVLQATPAAIPESGGTLNSVPEQTQQEPLRIPSSSSSEATLAP